MTKFYISLDFDGCIFNPSFFEELKKSPLDRAKALLSANQQLITTILSKTTECEKVGLLIGSNRQSNRLDVSNGLKSSKSFSSTKNPNSGSCFPNLINICSELNKQIVSSDKDIEINRFYVDKFLLADLYNDKEDGSSFDLALTETAWDQIDTPSESYLFQLPAQSHPETITDSSKITLLYAQIHKIAADHSNTDEPIVFEFFDDIESILTQIHEFFKSHNDLLPKNVTLNLFRYPHQNEIVSFGNITGKGEIDYNFKKNVIKLAALCGFDMKQNDFFNAIKTSHIHAVVDEFKLERKLQKTSIVSPAVNKSKKRGIFFVTTDTEYADTSIKNSLASPTVSRGNKRRFLSITTSDTEQDTSSSVDDAEEVVLLTLPSFKRNKI